MQMHDITLSVYDRAIGVYGDAEAATLKTPGVPFVQ